jgi:hypothetical protein
VIPYTGKAIQTAILASTKTLFSQPEEGIQHVFLKHHFLQQIKHGIKMHMAVF